MSTILVQSGLNLVPFLCLGIHLRHTWPSVDDSPFLKLVLRASILKAFFCFKRTGKGKASRILSSPHTHCLVPEHLWVNAPYLVAKQWFSLQQFVMKHYHKSWLTSPHPGGNKTKQINQPSPHVRSSVLLFQTHTVRTRWQKGFFFFFFNHHQSAIFSTNWQ